jgi:hypothetical protein
VTIGDSAGTLGSFRYLLFEISATESDDPFGNTFYREIDVIGVDDTIASAVRGGHERFTGSMSMVRLTSSGRDSAPARRVRCVARRVICRVRSII